MEDQRDANDQGELQAGSGRLRQFVAYARSVFGLDELFAKVSDTRINPKASPSLIAQAVFFCGLLRIRSFNALEPKLAEASFRALIGAPAGTLGCVDTVSRGLHAMKIDNVRAISHNIIAKAERNKVFREGWIGTLRFVALDGWEPFSSYSRHCEECLERRIFVKGIKGEKDHYRTQYYHRFVVAMQIDDRMDLILDFEPILPADLREDQSDLDEGELTSAKRLLRRVKKRYPWIDAVIGDALYSNGPFMTLTSELRMSGFFVLKKDSDEPLKEALSLWDDDTPCEVIEAMRLRTTGTPRRNERIQFWDCREIETLETYKGKVRVVRAVVTDLDDKRQPSSTWCIAVIGKAAKSFSPRQCLNVVRGRWHIENTGFHQWSTRWQFTHLFTHGGNAIRALFWLFFAAYNLLTIFMYRQVLGYGRNRGTNTTRTISRLVDEMLDALPSWNTS
ncbi:MAG: transposase [Deltaproteobacteria bacterium]|nr:transposase [Deltaproteobacteria bacterium]